MNTIHSPAEVRSAGPVDALVPDKRLPVTDLETPLHPNGQPRPETVLETVSPNGTFAAQPSLDDISQEGMRLQELVEKLDALPDAPTRVLAQECIQSILAFYGHGLAQILRVLEKVGTDGTKSFQAVLQDKLISGL